MLSVHQVSKSFELRPVLKAVTFTLTPGERLCLVGPNGCGKTTLLRIITGQERADTGRVLFDVPGLHWGYLPQGQSFAEGETLSSYLDRLSGGADALALRLEALGIALAANPADTSAQAEYDSTLAALQSSAENAASTPALRHAFGLDALPDDLPVASLSGGQKTRLALAGVLLSNPQLLLLDEPTNHLDLPMLEWLEDWLLRFQGAVLLVSHDRTFLDRVATSILELDAVTHNARVYPGNFSAYWQAKQTELEHQWQDYTDQQGEIARLKRAARHMRGLAQPRKGGKADTGDKFAAGFFANRGLATVSKAKNIEHRLERLLDEDKVDKPRQTWEMRIQFGELDATGRHVLGMEDLSVGYGDNVLLSKLNLHLRYGERVVLVGTNGSGKTTLLRTIAGVIPTLAGRVMLGSNVHLGYMTQEQSELNPALNALQTLAGILSQNETELRSFLSQYLFKGDDVYTPAGSLSYGERARLMLACLVASGCNVLLLDEPINHLDISARTRFEEALSRFPGTILAVVHDRYFIQRFASTLWQVEDQYVRVVG